MTEQDPIRAQIVEGWHRQREAAAARREADLERVVDSITTRVDRTEAETAEKMARMERRIAELEVPPRAEPVDLDAMLGES